MPSATADNFNARQNPDRGSRTIEPLVFELRIIVPVPYCGRLPLKRG
jgi:hypothetical protein